MSWRQISATVQRHCASHTIYNCRCSGDTAIQADPSADIRRPPDSGKRSHTHTRAPHCTARTAEQVNNSQLLKKQRPCPDTSRAMRSGLGHSLLSHSLRPRLCACMIGQRQKEGRKGQEKHTHTQTNKLNTPASELGAGPPQSYVPRGPFSAEPCGILDTCPRRHTLLSGAGALKDLGVRQSLGRCEGCNGQRPHRDNEQCLHCKCIHCTENCAARSSHVITVYGESPWLRCTVVGSYGPVCTLHTALCALIFISASVVLSVVNGACCSATGMCALWVVLVVFCLGVWAGVICAVFGGMWALLSRCYTDPRFSYIHTYIYILGGCVECFGFFGGIGFLSPLYCALVNTPQPTVSL